MIEHNYDVIIPLMEVTMQNAIGDIGFLLAGLGGGTLLADNKIGATQLSWVILGIGIILTIGSWVSEPVRIFFYGRPIDDWEFVVRDSTSSTFSEYPEKVFLENKREAFWEGLAQNQGDYYKLDLRKERLISAVHFNHGESNKCPNKWQMFLYDSSQKLVSPYKINRPPHIDGTGPILAEFEKAVKVRYIMVRITEQNSGVHWAIESIRIRENRLFGLRKAIIGGLDKRTTRGSR
jgi:hypothetical protein